MTDNRPRTGRPGPKDGSQEGFKTGGRGMNRSPDNCRHEDIKKNRK